MDCQTHISPVDILSPSVRERYGPNKAASRPSEGQYDQDDRDDQDVPMMDAPAVDETSLFGSEPPLPINGTIEPKAEEEPEPSETGYEDLDPDVEEEEEEEEDDGYSLLVDQEDGRGSEDEGSGDED